MNVDTSRILRAGAIGAVIGSIANLIIWVIARQTGLTLSVPRWILAWQMRVA